MLTLDRPRDNDLHTLADFAELLCLLKPDRVLSDDDLRDHLFDEGDTRITDDELVDALAQISWRSGAFAAGYPFAVAAHGASFSAARALSDEQRAYVFTLLCANLAHVPRSVQASLTDAFERAALCALRRIWPVSGTVRPFGKNTSDYSGDKPTRLTALGRDIGGRPILKASQFRRGDSGDGGIDLVAWLDLDSTEKENIPAALAQCACSRHEWHRKQYEISHGALAKQLWPTAPWLEIIFIPISFRDNTGRWAVDAQVHQSIVVDRLRLLRHLDFPGDWSAIAPPPFFESFLASQLALV